MLCSKAGGEAVAGTIYQQLGHLAQGQRGPGDLDHATITFAVKPGKGCERSPIVRTPPADVRCPLIGGSLRSLGE